MVDPTNLDKTAERIERLVRFMWAQHHPDDKLEIDRERLKLDILTHAAIATVFREIPYDEEG